MPPTLDAPRHVRQPPSEGLRKHPDEKRKLPGQRDMFG
jgi:hypothetical protein